LLLLPPSLPPFLTWFLPKYTSSLQPQQSVVIFHGHLDLSASDRLFVGGEGGGGREGGGGGGGEEGGLFLLLFLLFLLFSCCLVSFLFFFSVM